MKNIIKVFAPVVYFIHLILARVVFFFEPADLNNFIILKGDPEKLKGKVFLYLAVGSRITCAPIQSCMQFYKYNGYSIAIIIQGALDQSCEAEYEVFKLGDFIVKRINLGYDFGGYKYFFKEFLRARIDQLSELIIQNDSVYFPACDPAKFSKWLTEDKDIGAAIANLSDRRPHFQSFFIQLKTGDAVRFFSEFIDQYLPLNSKVHAINNGEIALSEAIRKTGLVCNIFMDQNYLQNVCRVNESMIYDTNMMHSVPIPLISIGFPFLKWDLFSRKKALDQISEYGMNNISRAIDQDKFMIYANKLLLQSRHRPLLQLLTLFYLRGV